MGKLKVDLLGTSFTIQANEETEYLEKLLGYYKRITDDVQKIDTVKTPLQISILSGIMLCDELYKEKKKNAENIDKKEDLFEAERLTLQMIEKITRVL